MKKDIIYVDSGPILAERLSGVGHLALNMIRGLLADKDLAESFEIRLMVPIAKTHLLEKWNLGDVKVVRIPLLSRIWNVWPRIPFAPPIDLFLGKGMYLFPNYKRWPLLFSRSITYIHDISFELFPEFTEPRNLTMLKANVPRWIDKSSLVITDSETSRKEIIEHYRITNTAKVCSVYCGVDSALFHRADTDQIQAVRQQYQIQKPYFFFLSNLEPRKNIVRLIQALVRLPPEYKECLSLVMVGGMSWREDGILDEIKKARDMGWTIIKPSSYVPDEDIPALISGAEALVHPALHEGFGIPVIEAMACGVPVLASDIPVLREVSGDAALYADPYDVSDISDHMETILRDEALRKRLIEKGTEQSAKFTWDAATSELIRYIKELNR